MNPFVTIYKTAHERLLAEGAHADQPNVSLSLHFAQHTDQRRYNIPTTLTEVAAIIPYSPNADTQDIMLCLQNPPGGGNRVQCIHDCNPAFDALHYVLLFPLGDLGWRDLMPKHPNGHGGKLPQAQYYTYRLHEHTNEPPTLLYGGKLFQQFVVDAWARIEQSKLSWLRFNQGTLCAAQLNGIMDAAHAGDHLSNVGQPIILPSGHIGSPQSMFQFCQDSYAVAAAFGPKPDLFITVTANPQWEDIQVALLPGQVSSDRPDIVTRVFHLKIESLLDEITNKGIFGTTVAHIYTIEFQKHGLPHMHLLIFLNAAAKPITPAQVDSIVCAELPDQAAEPHLYSIVSKVMIHRPCGALGNSNAVCLDDKGKCTKGFPKSFSEETVMTADGYPTYHHCNTGTHEVGGQAHSIDNHWVVLYNPYLSGCYECHINAEVCVSVCATKYIHKYIFKGHDQITAVVEQDEIKQYLDARWLGDSEAMYCLFAYHTHKEWPPVERLPIHLADGQIAVYDPARHDAAQVIQRVAAKDTKLLAFFKLNETDPRARTMLYSEIPYHY